MGETVDAKDLRIVSLSPVITEIIASIGEQDSLVGVTTHCDYPDSVREIEKIGDYSPSLEAIIRVNPDVVIGLSAQGQLIKRLKELGVNVLSYKSPNTVDDAIEMMEEIGSYLEKEERVKDVIYSIKNRYRSKALNHEQCVAIIQASPLIIAGKNTYISDLVRKSGGQYLDNGSRINFPQINEEILIRLEPQRILFLSEKSREQFQNKKVLFNYINKNKIKTFVISDPDLIARAGPRLGLAIGELSNWFSR